MMWRFPEAICRYVKLDLTDLRADPFDEENSIRFGFAEIELFSRGQNVAIAKSVSAKATISPKAFRRTLAQLTDGRNIYGSILPIRDWMRQLARRHELEFERPLVEKELNRLYDRQKITLRRLGWLSALLAVAIGFTILIDRLLRMRQITQVKERLAADLHDELGANVHTMGLLSDAANIAHDSPEEWNMLHQRIRALTNRTGTAIRHVGNMLEAKGLYIGLVEDMRRAALRITAKIEHTFVVEGESYLDQLEARKQIDLFLFYKESLINICRHSNATRFNTKLSATPREVVLSVSDDGKGLSGQPIPSSLKRRARLLKAKLTITEIPNDGTGITLRLRLRSKKRKDDR
jgi:signal transduction histidine kinase